MHTEGEYVSGAGSCSADSGGFHMEEKRGGKVMRS